MSDEIIIEQCTICKKIQRIICRDGSTITLRKHKCSECQKPAEKIERLNNECNLHDQNCAILKTENRKLEKRNQQLRNEVKFLQENLIERPKHIGGTA